MPERVPTANTLSVAAPWQLQVSRLCLEYVRDTILISRGEGDLLDALVFTTALDANMAPVERIPDLRLRYGGAERSAPDALRRPVSMHAVAGSLGLPFETVRRRFQRLIDAGACRATPGGIVVPRGAVTSEAYKAIQRARYRRAARLYRDLRTLEVLPAARPLAAPPDAPLVRAANRALSEYMLRSCRDLLALTGDVLTTLVLMQLALANTRGLDGEDLARWGRDPLAASKPARIAALADGLPLTGETVRRHLLALKAAGFCRRVSGGFVASLPDPARGTVADLAQANLGNLRRLFSRLGALGVLAEWEAEDAPA